MKKVLMTGSTGFVGRNVLEKLISTNKYNIITPHRGDLNLFDENQVRNYLKKEKFDVVLHFANPTPGRSRIDKAELLLEDSMRMYMNLYNGRDLFGKMIYTGSGAEYDKSKDINKIREIDCFRNVPKDAYGLSKFLMNQLAVYSNNVFNFRIFGCFGPFDSENKFITHCIRSIVLDVPITIRSDCEFDYLHVYDFAKYIEWGIDNELNYHDYNVASGKPYLLSEIAEIVKTCMEKNNTIELLSSVRNKNYTADCTRIENESKLKLQYPLEVGIMEQVKWELENWSEETKFDGK